MRLVHSIEFLKDPYRFCEFIIALLSLNISIEEMHRRSIEEIHVVLCFLWMTSYYKN